MRSVLLLLALALAGGPASAAPAPNQTGKFIIKLRELPPPPRLIRITDRIEAEGSEVERGGRRAPYILVTPKTPHKYTPPRELKTLIEFVDREVWMKAIELRPRRPRGSQIGEPVSGPGEPLPEAAQVPNEPSIPNDQLFARQWGMLDIGYGIKLPSARRYSRGAGVIVGIVDSGVRRSLSDLQGVDFLPGYNAILTKGDGNDDNSHGSHVCGTIAQATDNGIGCAGVAPRAQILPVKALDATGWGTNFTIGAGIRYAVDHGAKIINMSIGGSPSPTLKDAVTYAANHDVLLVASSGNGSVGTLTYPAAYPECLSVGAIDSSGLRASWSQWGPGLGIVAPGVEIIQQTFIKKTGQSGYFAYSGTSMAAPHVTGVAALVASLRPGITRAELKTLLTSTATDLGPRGYDMKYGWGLVNALAACERAAGGAAPVPPPTVPPTVPPETPLPPVDPVPVPPVESFVGETVALFNVERARVGLRALVVESRLVTAAQLHAIDQQAHSLMSHTGSDGSNPGQRIARAGYPAITWGENVAWGYQTPEAVVRAWMNSPGHRANILNGQFTEVGVGKAGTYWCNTFGARRQ